MRTIFSILEIILASTLRCPSDIFDDDDDDGDDDGDDDDDDDVDDDDDGKVKVSGQYATPAHILID